MTADDPEFHVLEVENKLSGGAGGGIDDRNLEFTLELGHDVQSVGRSGRAKLDSPIGDTAPRQTTRRSTHDAKKTET